MTAPEDTICSRCGVVLRAIGGLCANCLARSAVDRDTGWLTAALGGGSKDAAQPTVEGWRITGTLGAGGMGRVYQAESERDGSAAAIKVLDQRWSDDPAMTERFANEARLLQRLAHPNILRLLESTETDDGRLCLVTELVEGCDLGRLLRAERLPAARAMEIFDKVCAAVSHAHEHGLIHRDIKPSNILVGRDGAVKLADFGLARDTARSDASMIGALTATTDQFGTAYYLAPERMRGRTASGPEADVFSLGVLLYHLLTGDMPLGKYVPMSQLAAAPREFDAIVARALEADPTQRTASVADFQREVAALWREHTAGTLRARKWKRAGIIAASIAFLLAAAGGGAWWQHERMKPQPIVFADPAKATQQQPWENSLGMKFVPVPGTRVLFSIYETRRRDLEPFTAMIAEQFQAPWSDVDLQERRQAVARLQMLVVRGADGQTRPGSYRDPGWPVTPEHPAIYMQPGNAVQMAQWLTWKEQTEGRLRPGQRYRLPTGAEWLAASGGAEAPLPPGNRAGPEARDSAWPAAWPTLEVRDDFPRTAPVGSFPPEPHGLYDLAGNVAEWVCDTPEGDPSALRDGTLRGPSYAAGTPERARLGHIVPAPRGVRLPMAGFRLVLEWQVAE
jgi:serine/threonine protein kinase